MPSVQLSGRSSARAVPAAPAQTSRRTRPQRRTRGARPAWPGRGLPGWHWQDPSPAGTRPRSHYCTGIIMRTPFIYFAEEDQVKLFSLRCCGCPTWPGHQGWPCTRAHTRLPSVSSMAARSAALARRRGRPGAASLPGGCRPEGPARLRLAGSGGVFTLTPGPSVPAPPPPSRVTPGVRASAPPFSLSSHHLISQAGWNRCNLSIYLSIYLPVCYLRDLSMLLSTHMVYCFSPSPLQCFLDGLASC